MKMRTGFLLPALLPALLLTVAPAFAASSSASFREAAADTLFIGLQPGEKVWGARVADGSLMPYAPGFEGEMYYNGNNQIQPLLITDMGRYVWSEEPFAFRVEDDGIVITAETGGMKTPLHLHQRRILLRSDPPDIAIGTGKEPKPVQLQAKGGKAEAVHRAHCLVPLLRAAFPEELKREVEILPLDERAMA